MPTAAGLHYFLHEGENSPEYPLLLIHGAGGDHLSWPSEMRHLPGHRVFALDLPGHGKTDGPGCQAIEDYASAVVKFMDVLGFSRAVFTGHAMGGAIALALARHYPDRVAGIGLISTGPCLPVPAALIENACNPSTLPLAIKNLQEMSLGPQTPAYLGEHILKRLAQTRQPLLVNDLLACDRFNMSDGLPSIRTPALVVCGSEDRLTPIRFSQLLSSRIPGAALQIMDGAGHLLLLEQPVRLAKLISIFLTTIPYRPGS